ncbi:MAG TPA: aspartate 1-decarboxylase [Verrucomicrobiota bacterium]|nr:aspartate 1-decarboxylase [Verrucomicrobiota bacterium]HNU50910.1 aspartate 1-decarboxylase [Verrucomicrobiota bacterium]
MQVHLLKSKIHRAHVTGANVKYEGSLTIDADLMDQVGLMPYERILCGNMANGARFETYTIPGQRGKREIVLNGAVAHLGAVGDRLTIMSYALVEAAEAVGWTPRVVVLGHQNAVVNSRGL